MITLLSPKTAQPDAEVYAASVFDRVPVRYVNSVKRVHHFTVGKQAFRQPVLIRAYPNREIVVHLRRGVTAGDIEWADALIKGLREGRLKSMEWSWDEARDCFENHLAHWIPCVEWTPKKDLLVRANLDPHDEGPTSDFHDLTDIFYMSQAEGFFNDRYEANLCRNFGGKWQVEVSTENAEPDIEWSSDTVSRLASDVAWLESTAAKWNAESVDLIESEQAEILYFNAHRDEWQRPEIEAVDSEEIRELDEFGNLRGIGHPQGGAS